MTVRDAIGGLPPAGPPPASRGTGRPRRWKWLAVAGIAMILALGLAATGKIVHASISTCSAASGGTAAVATDCLFAGFEIDGDTPANNGGLDWQSSPQVFGSQAYTPFYDLSASTSDNIMGKGAKESDQSTWSCVTQKSDPKNDLGATFLASDYSATTTQFNASGSKQWAGAIWFETVNNKQYLFGSFQRLSANGDAHIDFEFNRAKQTFSCGGDTLPTREKGDVLITFDGNGPLTVAAFTWNCNVDPTAQDPKACTGPGSFTTDTGLTPGGTFAGQTNTSTQTDPNLAAGVFGEASLNLTDTIGSFTCGEFGDAFMKDRTATASDIASGSAEVKDYVSPEPFNPGLCPTSSVTKAQADETSQSADSTPNTTANESGSTDMTADAALTYTKECTGATGTPTVPAASAGCGTNPTTPLSASKGDELSYQVTYQNTGGGPAPNPVVQDNLSAATGFTGDTYVAGSQSCPTNATCIAASTAGTTANPTATYNSGTPCSSTNAVGDQAVGVLVWCLPSEPANASVPLYFEVDLPSVASSSGTEYFGNYATVTDTGVSSDTGGASNFVAAKASFAPVSGLVKKEADVQPSNQYCNTASGGAITSNTVCNSLMGTANSSPTFSTGPINAKPGDIIEYQLTYSNTGDAPATNVVISDTIPTNSTYVGGTAAGADSPTVACFNGSVQDTDCSGSQTVTKITWTYTSVSSGGSEAVTFEVKAAAAFPGSTSNVCPLPQGQSAPTFTASQIGNCATVVTDQTTSIPSGNVIANVAGAGALTLSKSASVSGSQITYTITYKNVGDQALSSQSITDTIPTGLTFVSCGPASVTCSDNSGTPDVVTWSGINIAAGATGTLTLVVTQ